MRLLNPRIDIWEEHLLGDGARLVGKTAVGRVTVAVLSMNDADMVMMRSALLGEAEARDWR